MKPLFGETAQQEPAPANSSPQPPFRPPHVDHCSCSKPPGCWGEAGWHFRELDETEIAAREVDRLAAELKRSPTREERQQRVRYAAHVASLYAGTPYGYERCSAYAAALARERDEIRRKNGHGPRHRSNLDRDAGDDGMGFP